MAEPAVSTPPRFFHGWLVVAAAFAVTFIGFGSAYTFSAFVDPLQRDFGASRGAVSLVFSLAGFLYFGLGVVSGPLADRFGSRRLAVAGMILMAIGLAAASAAQQPAAGLCRLRARRWSRRRLCVCSGHRRGAAMVRAAPRLCLRPCCQRDRRRHAWLMPPLASLLIQGFGWRGAYLALGAIAAVVGGGLALLIENDPRDRGLAPDGDALQSDAHAVSAAGDAGGRGHSITPVHRSLRCLPDLFVRRIRAVRSSRALCPGSWRCRLGRGAAACRDRCRQHRRALLPRRPRRPDGPSIVAAADVDGHGGWHWLRGRWRRISGRWQRSRSCLVCSTAGGLPCSRRW